MVFFLSSEPFGVGVVASSALVGVGEILNEHDNASTENSPAIEHRFQFIETCLI